MERAGERRARASLQVTHCPAQAGKSRQRRTSCLRSFSQFPPSAALAPPTAETTPTTPRPRPPTARATPPRPIGWRSASTERPEDRRSGLPGGVASALVRMLGAAGPLASGGRGGALPEGVRPAGRDGEEPGGRQRFRAAADGLATGRCLRRDGGPGRRGLSAAGTRRCEAGSR